MTVSDNFKWLGSHVFSAEGEYSGVAYRHPSDFVSWWSYSESYKDAADRIVDSAAGAALDNMLFPVCFLYRHSLELALKAIMFNVAETEGIDPLKLGHNLSDLWAYIRDRIAPLVAGDDTLECWVEMIGQRIEEWNNIDAESFGFRYHRDRDKKGNPAGLTYAAQCEQLSSVNLRMLKSVMSDMHNCLFGFYDVLSPTFDPS